MISSVGKFSLKLKADKLSNTDQKKLSKYNNPEALVKMLKEPQYLRVSCKTDISSQLGSMFVVLRDEEKSHSEYIIENHSKLFDIIYGQYINPSTTAAKFTHIKV